MILAPRFTFIDERSRKTCIFTQTRLNHLLCFSDAPLYHESLIRIMPLKFEINKKLPRLKPLSTITTTLKFSGFNTSPVLRNVSNKRNGVIFIGKKPKFKLSVTVYKIIFSVMFQRFWLLLL